MTIKDTADNGNAGGVTDGGVVEKKVAPDSTNDTKIGDVLKQMDPNKVVGLDKFLEIKKENKNLRKDLNNLMETIRSNASQSQTKNEMEELAKQYDVNPEFLDKLVKTIEKNVSKKSDTSTKAKSTDDSDDSDDEEDLTPNEAALEAAFTKEFDKAMAKLEDFADVVNKDAIFALSRLPKNADKTMTKIIEETYGKTLTGKRTIDSAKPGAGKEAQKLDYARAKKDTEYFKQVMADPDLKKEYNERMISSGII